MAHLDKELSGRVHLAVPDLGHICGQTVSQSPHLAVFLMEGLELGPTGSFKAVSYGPRPADAVDQRAVHVTPEVVRPVVALLIHQPQTAPDHLPTPPQSGKPRP